MTFGGQGSIPKEFRPCSARLKSGPPDRCKCLGSISKAQWGHRMWLGSAFACRKLQVQNSSLVDNFNATFTCSPAPSSIFIFCLSSLAVRLSIFLWRLWLRWRRRALAFLAQLQEIQGMAHGKFDEVWTERGRSTDEVRTKCKRVDKIW